MHKMVRTRAERPEVVKAAHEATAKKDLGVVSMEPWTWGRHAREKVLIHCPRFRRLRRMIVAVAAGLDIGRIDADGLAAAVGRGERNVVQNPLDHRLEPFRGCGRCRRRSWIC